MHNEETFRHLFAVAAKFSLKVSEKSWKDFYLHGCVPKTSFEQQL